jgi:hypothetical protein
VAGDAAREDLMSRTRHRNARTRDGLIVVKLFSFCGGNGAGRQFTVIMSTTFATMPVESTALITNG